MKKFVFTLLLVLGCQISLAQNSAALFDEFRREKNAEYVSASPFLMRSPSSFICISVS